MKQHVRNKAYLAGGIILSILGVLWLIHALGIVVPEIIVSFPSLIMLIGLITLIQTKFKSEVAWVIFGFGVVLMLNKLFPNQNIWQIGLAGLLLILGIYYLIKYFTETREIPDFTSNNDQSGD